ncbi:hypothetical protein GCM10010347_05720 [Streptomyces cirratus]|uniref:Uncharacterized protein n=1 Tax=Streptomyces cirratus TaxID=68187 RepID=A0ABQ3EN66_9ACTN|nr:hypothetical protein [Streptomyces cirratus]GHB39105.1 hypothetical protein GCM10010347_05720 [Streptomyces cirratus]
MSRTAHHIRSRRRTDHTAAVLAVLVHDLRYSARCRAEAARGRHRPRPQATRRHTAIRHFPRVRRDRSVSRWAAQEERRARQRLRADARTLLRLTHPGRDGQLDLRPAEETDIRPARHRRAALWLA